MGEVASTQRWAVGAAGLPTRLKGGWGPGTEPGGSGGYLDRQLGVVTIDRVPLAVAIATRPADGSHETGTRNLTAIAHWFASHASAAVKRTHRPADGDRPPLPAAHSPRSEHSTTQTILHTRPRRVARPAVSAATLGDASAPVRFTQRPRRTGRPGALDRHGGVGPRITNCARPCEHGSVAERVASTGSRDSTPQGAGPRSRHPHVSRFSSRSIFGEQLLDTRLRLGFPPSRAKCEPRRDCSAPPNGTYGVKAG